MALIAAVGIGYIYYQSTNLLLSNSNVDSGTIPSSTISILLNFNKDIDPSQNLDEVVTVSPSLQRQSIRVNKKQLEIIYDYLDANIDYEIKLKNLKSTDGLFLSQSIKFKTSYVPYNLQSKDQQKQALEDTNKELRNFPILNELPYEEERFKIEGDISADQQSIEYTITLFAILNREDQTAQYRADLKAFKAASLKWLTDQNVDVSKAKITYIPEDPDSISQ
ncbi:hypothetical protein IT415_02680 [bacterium]|nr:hypothetical protein [bacterium]